MSTGLERMLFGPMPEGRECGGCVACCVDMLVATPELQKPANTMCVHCTGTGCGIHATRPLVCRSWDCVWRQIEALPDELRPDRSGVMFDLDRQRPQRNLFEHIFIIARAKDPALFDQPVVLQAIEMFVRQGQLPVWLSVDGKKRLIHPAGPLADAILDFDNLPADTDPALVEAARQWRDYYIPLAQFMTENDAKLAQPGLVADIIAATTTT